MALSVAALARGDLRETVERSIAAAALSRRPRENLGLAALALAYMGDIEQARSQHSRRTTDGAAPSMRSWDSYVDGEIEAFAGFPDAAVPHYVRAIELARSSGATFLAGVATVGLLAAQVNGGHLRAALTGYREVIDYFTRTGNWIHLWVTLRNLADLLRRLDDEWSAAVLDAAADRAPDAPADTRAERRSTRSTDAPPLDRNAVLDTARRAIDRALSRI
jgi:hypothetical protein